MTIKIKNNLFLSVSLLIFYCCACGKDTPTPTPDVTPKVSATGVTRFEGNEKTTSFVVKVILSQAAKQTVSVDYATVGIGAKPTDDYIDKNGTLSIPVGATSTDLSIDIVTDTIRESDEDFKILFSNPKNATLALSEVICTIRNDDTYIPTSSNDGYTTPDNYSGYTLAWADEFNGTQIDPANWGYDIGGGGWGNDEWQFYTAESRNAYVKNGRLIIEALKEKYQNRDYTSARLITKGKREFTFGRVDIRAKLPKGQGIWPALWMLGSNIDQIGWPACGEIDIMELLGHQPDKTYGTIHWGKQGAGVSQTAQGSLQLTNGKTFADEFNVFSLDWEKDKLSILVNDKVIFSTTAAKLGAANYLYNSPYFFIMNIAVGGRWPGYPDATTVFPQRMEVDYIRVFQK
jgi:beta-glucanase (GH16 family)